MLRTGVCYLRVRAHLHVWVEVTGHLASRDFVVLSRTFVVLVPTNKKIQPNRSINNGKAEHTRDQYSSFSISHIETHKSLSFLPSRQTRAYLGLLTLTHKTIYCTNHFCLTHTLKKIVKKKNTHTHTHTHISPSYTNHHCSHTYVRLLALAAGSTGGIGIASHLLGFFGVYTYEQVVFVVRGCIILCGLL